RESKFLLSLLGLLAGIFVTALALRLLIPRPPEGAGPDIHTVTFNPFAETVQPPDLTPSPQKKSQWPSTHLSEVEQSEPHFPSIEASFEPSLNQLKERGSPLAQIQNDDVPSLETVNDNRRDDTRKPNAYRRLDSTPAIAPWQSQEPTTLSTPTKPSDDVISQLPPQPPPTVNSLPQTTITKPPQKPSPGMHYDVQKGDSWWELAEEAYGDGRYYRSLFAWNKTLHPRVSLSPGTNLEIPETNQLRLAWPQLIPTK
ncbi:MAG: hypothetical protein HN345_11455, partial [Planctomycetaceae bacterium]|nr:hypothetical protein [Planctomycetaceae bacterium]